MGSIARTMLVSSIIIDFTTMFGPNHCLCAFIGLGGMFVSYLHIEQQRHQHSHLRKQVCNQGERKYEIVIELRVLGNPRVKGDKVFCIEL